MKTTAAPVLLAFLLGAAASPGVAEERCQEGLQAAQKSYQIGAFEDVPAQLASCLTGSEASRTERVQAYALLAKAHLAMDEPEPARDAVSALLRADPAYEPGPPPQFTALVQQVRREEATAQVASVSKTSESLREAPATVVVVTGEEIERRGYLDLEELLHDLPAFDVSRGNGEVYSTFYQRGFRSNNSDRNLLLLDGVEQNDLSSNSIYLSRQYPLSALERVEVIYGPASTMYGANAYTGVINVLSKDPETLIAEGKRFGYSAQAGGGTFDSRFADLTLAGKTRSGNVAWSLTGRVFHSDENDLSGMSDWDYDYLKVPDAVYRSAMSVTGAFVDLFCQVFDCAGFNPLYRVERDQRGQRIIVPSDLAVALARGLDQQAVEDHHIGFSDRTEDWFLYGRVRIANLTFGLERWRLEEGTAPWITNRPGEGSTWAPQSTSFHIKYSGSVGRNLSLQIFGRFIQSSLDRADTRLVTLHSYQSSHLRVVDLLNLCPAGGLCPQKPWIEVFSYGGMSSQLKGEATLVYKPTEKLDVVGGLDLRKGSIERSPDVVSAPRPDSPPPEPRWRPTVEEFAPIEHTDVAAYAQASYRFRPSWKAVLAGRLDYNEINNQRFPSSGFGALFTPRAALVYAPAGNPFTGKLIYSEAFKDPSDYEKFATVRFLRDVVSEGLRPERVRNFEVTGAWQPAEHLAMDAALYQADYRDVVGLRQDPDCIRTSSTVCGQLANLGRLRIRGVQMNARYSVGGVDFFGNYTYTEPFDLRPDLDPTLPSGEPLLPVPRDAGKIRIGDIASHRLNAGLEVAPLPRLIANLRLSYVSARKTGIETTVFTNPYDEIGDYLVPKLALTWRNLIPGTDLQLIINNVSDTSYDHPGVQAAGYGFAPRLPQPGRTVFLRLLSGGLPGRH